MTKNEFLHDVGNWNNHLYLLWPALEATTGDVVELGMGQGSTLYLRDYCLANKRKFFSYENNRDWFDKFSNNVDDGIKMNWIADWGTVSDRHATPGVLFLDHAPGERRKIDLALFAHRARIIVAHDTEPAADHGYQMRQHIHLFKWWVDYKTEGAWASAASNFVDVTKFV